MESSPESEQISLENQKEYSKTEDQLFRVFSLSKAPILKKIGANEQIEQYVDNDTKDIGRGERIETTADMEILKNRSINYIIAFCHYLKISLPENLKNKIHVELYSGGDTLPASGIKKGTVLINNTIYKYFQENFEAGNYDLMVHELIHIVATKVNKMYYDYKKNDSNKGIILNSISSGAHSGYQNRFVGGHKNEEKGNALNEGFTELITRIILKRQGIETVEEVNSFYIYYIYIIDGLIKELCKKIERNYDEVLLYLIKGNILGNMKFLNIIQEHIGKEFLSDLLDFGVNGTREETIHKQLKKVQKKFKKFINKYPSIYFSEELSDEIKEKIGNINFKVSY